jgi:hypothetical protein
VLVVHDAEPFGARAIAAVVDEREGPVQRVRSEVSGVQRNQPATRVTAAAADAFITRAALSTSGRAKSKFLSVELKEKKTELTRLLSAVKANPKSFDLAASALTKDMEEWGAYNAKEIKKLLEEGSAKSVAVADDRKRQGAKMLRDPQNYSQIAFTAAAQDQIAVLTAKLAMVDEALLGPSTLSAGPAGAPARPKAAQSHPKP